MAQKYSLTRRASLPGIANYETSADLPLVNVTPGRLAWVNDINSLFVFDNAWQRLDTTNLPPVFSAIPTELTVPVAQEYTLPLNDYTSDPDGLFLEYSVQTVGITDLDTIVEVTTDQDLLILPGYTPETFTIALTASDGIETAVTSITVTTVNTAPVIVPIPTQYPLYNPSVPFSVPLAFTDTDIGDSVIWSVDSTTVIPQENCVITSNNDALEVLIDSFYDPFTVTVKATQYDSEVTYTINFIQVSDIPAGEALFEQTENYGYADYVVKQITTDNNGFTENFVVPQGVNTISAVAIGSGGGAGSTARFGSSAASGGGGALSYSSAIPVTPGETLTVEFIPAQRIYDQPSINGGTTLKRGDTVLLFAEAGGSVNSYDSNDPDAPVNNQGGRASEGVGEVKFSGGSGGGAFQGQGSGYAGGGGAAGYLADGGNMGVQATAISSGGGNNVSNSGGSFNESVGGGGGVGVYGNIYSNPGSGYSTGVDGGQNGYSYKTETIGNSNYARRDNWAGAGYGGGNGIEVSGSGNDTVNPVPPEPFGSNGAGINGRPNNGALRIIYGSGRSYPNNGTQEVPATPLFTSDAVNFTITPGQSRTWSVTAESLEGNTVSYSFAIYEGNDDITLNDISIDGSEVTVTLPVSANDDTPFKIIVLATDDVTGGVVGQIADFTPIIVTGQVVYTSPGIYTFTVPDRVYSLSAVIVGGGGAGGWESAQGGTGGTSKFGEGESFYFYATGGAGGGQGQSPASFIGGAGGTYGGPGASGGGNGGRGRDIGGNNQRGAGGGAGGYAGNGGDGVGFNIHPQTAAGEGGGVGIYGQGPSGDGSLVWLYTAYSGVPSGSGGSGTGGGGYGASYNGSRQIDGIAGSGGQSAPPVDSQLGVQRWGGGGAGGANDGTYGAGGGGGALAYASRISVTPGQQITVEVGDHGTGALISQGAEGAARIIWGSNRQYPTSNVLDAGIMITNTEVEFTYPQNSTQTISLTVTNPNSENYTWSVIPLTNRLTQDNFTFNGDNLDVYLPGDDDIADHQFTVVVETDLGYKDAIDFTITPTVSSGDQVYTTPGSYTFTVPDGVGTIHAVAVGGGAGGAVGTGGASGGAGGGLGWGSFSVTPGETITIAVGESGIGSIGSGLGTDGGDSLISYNNATIIAGYGGAAGDGSAGTNLGGSFLAPSNGGGGSGGNSQIPGSGFQYAAGGGGAGGYSGNGGNGGIYQGSPGSGSGGAGAGGFSAGSSQDDSAGGGGGVGIYGEGPSGISISSIAPTPGGSGGTDGGAARNGVIGGLGGTYGGGGGGSNGTSGTNPEGGNGGSGAVRLVWGPGVSYPDNAIPAQASIYEYSASTQTFTVPTGVTNIGVAAVGSGGYADWVNNNSPLGGGGGAFSFTNSISVTPYETLDIVFDGSGSGIQREGTWLVYAEDGTWQTGGSGANSIGEVTFSGGSAISGPYLISASTSYMQAGGAGAGSYTDPGGNAEAVWNTVNAYYNRGDTSTETRTGAGTSGSSGSNPWGSPTAGGGGVGLQGANVVNETINLAGGGAYGGERGTYTPDAGSVIGNAIGGEYGGGSGYSGQNLDQGNTYSLYGSSSKPNNGGVAIFFSTAENQVSIPGGDLNVYSFNVINNGASAYTITGTDSVGEVSGDNPNITVNVGDVIVFNVNALNHPLYFKTSVVTGTSDTVDLAEGQGTDIGKVCWTPKTAGTYFYICEFHGTMYGQIIVTGNS